ncbi:hypothetical protein DFQ01_14319 [Paenibacillus cellulosilyticus]|uniref:Uncharacterized protein n=1 Tax=Paenibacillus cellulosilyticus TaxID=375489 RepID=A0A2V2YE33_9BACL|nr:hypothetical protein DFQ01_14319 [Paenibacillus cellulosilyticus]
MGLPSPGPRKVGGGGTKVRVSYCVVGVACPFGAELLFEISYLNEKHAISGLWVVWILFCMLSRSIGGRRTVGTCFKYPRRWKDH